MPKKLFSRRWILTTLLVLAAMAVMTRLGLWQLDRLAQRRAFNARVSEQMAQPPLELSGSALDADLPAMEYRAVVVTGEYDHAQQVVVRNQVWGNRLGVHLLTPLLIAGSDRAVMVDRGWIPLEDYQSGDWSAFDEPGVVTVEGIIRRSQPQPVMGGRLDRTPQPGERLDAWNFITLEMIGAQIPYPLLSVYIQQAPEEGRTDMPYRSLPEVELTEGPHLGYAVQWFLFALTLGVGYPFFVNKEEKRG